jgi:hypothetical protein
VLLGAFGALLTVGVLWAAAPVLAPASAGNADETGQAAVGVGFTAYS